MIHPTIHRYSAPYRGPRDKQELSNIMTSIWHDINVVYDTCSIQKTNSDGNVIFAMDGRGTPTLNFPTNAQINDSEVTYTNINNMVHSLDSVDTVLKNALKNL